MIEWGEHLGEYLNLWHWITLILEEHATGAKTALIDSGDIPNNFDFGQDVATNAQGFCARLDSLDLRMIFLFMPDWIFLQLAANVREMAVSCKKGFNPKDKYYFIDEKFVDELSQSDNRLLSVKTPEALSAAVKDEIFRIVSRTPKHNLSVMVTVFEGETHVTFKKITKSLA